MINSKSSEYYQKYYGAYLSEYLAKVRVQDTRFNYILAFIVICIILATIALSKPLFASTEPDLNNAYALSAARIETDTGGTIYSNDDFIRDINKKYSGKYITFLTEGAAHIRTIKYINSKPVKINIVEINTNVNPNLRVKPQIAGSKLNSKATVRKIAQKNNAIIAINGGFFKPQTGVPLGALMIDGKVLTGPIYNRVGIAIFENGNKTNFKLLNVNFDISAYTKKAMQKIDNINQPRMLCTHTLIYTSDWGKASPVAPQNGYNMLIEGNKILKISANPIEIGLNQMVLSAPKDVITKLAKNNNEIYIDLKLPKELEDASHIIGAGPYLVKDSEVYVDAKNQKLDAIAGKNPRSAIGFKNDGTLIILTIDGREKASVGMTLYELAKLMKSLGCEYAMNFDGGSSSAMYVKGRIVNSAINKEGIAVSNALVINETQENYQLSSI